MRWVLRGTAAVATAAWATLASAVPDVQVLAVGSNQSYVKSLKDLRFAAADAKRFVAAMQTVGLVPSVRAQVLTDATVKDFRDAFRQLAAQDRIDAKEGNAARKFIFYYSGHSDDKGLHLKDGLISKSELHDELTSLSAHTKVAILDSCFSGAISAKGVESAPPFELPRVEFDEPSGSVFLTASTGRQLAYESDNLGSSVFTHHLLNGLYGEADGNADGVVTVDELYQYVYRNTKWQSLNYPTRTAQEPEYVAKLQGQGAIVLSFPAKTNSKLSIDKDLRGEVTIASPRGMQFFKVDKEAGLDKTVQLPIGSYRVSVRDDDRIGEAGIKIETGRLAVLAAQDVKWRKADPVELAGAKGEASGSVQAEKTAEPPQTWRWGLMVGGHSGFVEEGSAGPFAEVNYERAMLKFTHFEMAWGAALNFHRNVVRTGYEGEPAPDDQKTPRMQTDSTGGYFTVALRGRKTVLLPALLSVQAGLGETYHDQLLDYGETHVGGAAPAMFSGLQLEIESKAGNRYGLIVREELVQTVGVSQASGSVHGGVVAMTASF